MVRVLQFFYTVLTVSGVIERKTNAFRVLIITVFDKQLVPVWLYVNPITVETVLRTRVTRIFCDHITSKFVGGS
jgi:hypothetical protein